MNSESRIVQMPRLLTVGWSNRIISLCSEAVAHEGPVVFDFRPVVMAAPFGLTLISVVLEKCLSHHKGVSYVPPNSRIAKEYLNRIGFDKIFLRKKIIDARPTSVELRRLDTLDPGYVEAILGLISSSIKFSREDEYQVRLHFNELLTNIFDHSQSKVGCYACAQYYPSQKNLRISVADGGIGIKESLNRSKRYGVFKDDHVAIKKAVEPGVTTRAGQAGGMGLTYIRDYVKRNKGLLTIMGGVSKVNFYFNKVEVKKHKAYFEGNIVDIRIKPGQVAIEPTSKNKEPIL